MAITIPELNSVSIVDDTDNIMLTHSNGNSEKISGAALKADMIKDKIENNNGNAVSVNAVSTILATSTTITGPELGTGGNIKILFTSAIAGVDTSTGMSLTYNGDTIAVKVGKDGALEDFKAVEVSTGVYKYLQAYTTLELVYNGTYFIIVGNPVVLSASTYTIYADGLKRVDNVVSGDRNMITGNAVVQNLINSYKLTSNGYSSTSAGLYVKIKLGLRKSVTASYYENFSYLITVISGNAYLAVYLINISYGNDADKFIINKIKLYGTDITEWYTKYDANNDMYVTYKCPSTANCRHQIESLSSPLLLNGNINIQSQL